MKLLSALLALSLTLSASANPVEPGPLTETCTWGAKSSSRICADHGRNVHDYGGEVMDVNSLGRGDWIEIEYGYSRRRFCVLKRNPESVVLLPTSWCNSSATTMTLQEVEEGKPRYFGRGKRKWWTYLFRPESWWLDLFHPYTEPNYFAGE